jgi:hypothetical protein
MRPNSVPSAARAPSPIRLLSCKSSSRLAVV